MKGSSWEMEKLQAIMPEVRRVAGKAAEFIRREREGFSQDRVEVKGEHDFVSYVDKGSERIILEELPKILPEAGIISEEGGGDSHAEGYNWIVDPLDGTTNFIHAMPPYAVSIGLVYNDEPVLGVIHEVGLDECFHAVKGGGAFCNNRPISTSACGEINDALIATGFPFRDYSRLEPFFETLELFMRQSHGLRRLGSAATDLAWLACGRVDAFYEYGLHAWDVAAGIVIAQEAGAEFADFDYGANYLYGGELLCAGKPLFPAFQKAISGIMHLQDA